MLEWIQGKVLAKEDPKVILQLGPVAFAAIVSNITGSKITVGETVQLFLEPAIRENDIKFFGFLNKNEREVFRWLNKVSDIGPQKAIQILSAMPWQEFLETVQAEDEHLLGQIKGIGPKTAKKIVVELKDRIKPGMVSEGEVQTVRLTEDSLNALGNLGFNRSEVRPILEKIIHKNSGIGLEELIKQTLQRLRST